MDKPDFEALRAKRNEEMAAIIKKISEEFGFENVGTSFNPNSCYCACSSGGPCEHTWDGKPYENEEEGVWSATCSRCGCTAISHSLRTGF